MSILKRVGRRLRSGLDKVQRTTRAGPSEAKFASHVPRGYRPPGAPDEPLEADERGVPGFEHEDAAPEPAPKKGAKSDEADQMSGGRPWYMDGTEEGWEDTNPGK